MNTPTKSTVSLTTYSTTNLHQFIHHRLQQLGANQSDPRWSSYILAKFFDTVILSMKESITDILQEVYLSFSTGQLTHERANFVQDLVKIMFANYRNLYEHVDLSWICQQIMLGCTSSQAYLALRTIPPHLYTSPCVDYLYKALENTPYWDEAIVCLEDVLSS